MGPVYGQGNIKLEDSVYSIHPEILIESNREEFAPNRIQIIDAAYIKRVNGSRLSDILNTADGIFIKDYGFNSGLKMISMNSTQSEQSVIMYRGVKLNSRQNSLFDAGLLQTDDITSITVSSGGSSALYGSDAVGGVININSGFTGYDLDKRNIRLILKGSIASYNTGRIYSGIMNKPSRNFFYGISYSYESSPNKYEYYIPDGLGGQLLKQRENADYSNHYFNLSSDWNINSNSKLSFFTLYSYWNRGVPGVELGYSSSIARQIDHDLISSLKYNRTINKKTGYELNANYKYSLMNYYDPATFGLSTPINSFYKLNTLKGTGLFEFNYAKAGELHLGFETEKSNFMSNETIEGSLFQGSISASLKHQFDRKSSPYITIYPSIRYDYYSNISNKNVITSKLGINILPVSDIDFSIKSSIGNNFLAPTFNELYWKDLGNPDLKPERSVNFDCGLFYKFHLLIKNEIEASYFFIKSIDRIVWQPGSSNLWRPVNIGSVISEGINISYKGDFTINKRLNAKIEGNYNFGKSTKQSEDFPDDLSFGKQLIYIPQEFFKASVGLSYLTTSKYIKFVSLKSFYNYSGKRYSNAENTFYSPHYGIFDLNVTAELNIFRVDIDIKFAVNNVMNENYQVVPGYPMPLRNFKLEFGFKY